MTCLTLESGSKTGDIETKCRLNLRVAHVVFCFSHSLAFTGVCSVKIVIQLYTRRDRKASLKTSSVVYQARCTFNW